jgi:hypothetical protein
MLIPHFLRLISHFLSHGLGTTCGEILTTNPEKGLCITSWNAKDELLDDNSSSSGKGGSVSSAKLYIRRISWLAPQDETSNEQGCLFALLATSAVDNDNLNNVIVGLHPRSIATGEMNVIFALPPIPNEKIISFRVVPTYNKSLSKNGAVINKGGDSFEKTPGLLLLVQRSASHTIGDFERHLSIIRCPTTNMTDWGLEIGALPDPRKAREVQPAASDITVSHVFSLLLLAFLSVQSSVYFLDNGWLCSKI